MSDSSPTLLVGTGKGLLIWQRNAEEWALQAPQFLGFPVPMIYVDPYEGTWWAGLAHRHWGQKLRCSHDQGQSWQELPMPVFPADALLSNGRPARLRRIWCMAAAGPDKPDAMWLGAEPGALFYRPAADRPFELVQGLWDHPSRHNPAQWFGAGRDHPFIHSIEVDPRDSNHVYVAVSCAGVFETRDGGRTWTPRNEGLIAAYLPNPHVAVGHDPHRVLLCPAQPDVLWQQNHCGVFRSTDGAATWQLVNDDAGLADYGFALAVDESDPEKAWVIPAESDEMRVSRDLALTVSHTNDGGRSWQALRNGLPRQHAFDIVFRHAFAKAGSFMAFGTTNGNLYVSEDDGQSWQVLSHQLARVECVVWG
ncbi:MAG: glycosyl hydrolase [Bacteroidota bacterium]